LAHWVCSQGETEKKKPDYNRMKEKIVNLGTDVLGGKGFR